MTVVRAASAAMKPGFGIREAFAGTAVDEEAST